jgi:hypothetical protein
MKPEFLPEDIALYLQSAVMPSETPRLGRDGRVLLRCPVRSQPPHDISMDPTTGKWLCLGGTCGCGDIFDYHSIKFKISRQREAENAVVQVIREAREKIRQAEEAIRAARYATVDDCPKFVRGLLRIIDRHPAGISRRDLQQKAHWSANQFRKGLRELERRGLMRWERQKCAQGPARIVYFPIALASGGQSPKISAEAANLHGGTTTQRAELPEGLG